MRITYFVKYIKLVVKEVINSRSRVSALTRMRVVMGLYILRKSQRPNVIPHARNSAFHLPVFLFHFNDIGKSVTHPLVNAITKGCLLSTSVNRIKTMINR